MSLSQASSSQEYLSSYQYDQRINDTNDLSLSLKMKSNYSSKKVHFANSPVIYRSVPWLTHSNEYQSNADLEAVFISEPNQFIYDSSLKNDFAQLRVPYNKSQQMNLFGFIIIIFCFIFIFSLIWWIAQKLLMIEIEQQMSNNLHSYHSNSNIN